MALILLINRYIIIKGGFFCLRKGTYYQKAHSPYYYPGNVLDLIEMIMGFL